MYVAVLVLLSVLFTVAPGRAAEPDAALLGRVEQLRQAARQVGSQLWPGWDPLATPLAIYKGSEMTLLVGHPSPPAGFRRVSAPAVSAAVFVSDSTAGFAHANTAQNFAGVLTSFLSYENFMEKPAPEGIALTLHELFHALEQRIAPGKAGDILVLLWGQYPEFLARNRALLGLEAATLLGAVSAENDAGTRRAASEFLAIRAERRKDLAPELARYESGEEASEGLAQYVEWRALQALPGGGVAGSDSAKAAASRFEPLKTINNLANDRQKFYFLGMAQAAVLDRLRPGWKNDYQSSPALLDELLAKSVEPLSSQETAALLERLAYPKALAEQEKEVERRAEEGSQRLQRLFAGGGQRVVFEMGALKNHLALRGFNPNGSVAISPTQTAHIFLMLDLGVAPLATLRLEFRGVPAIYDAGQDALWTLLPDAAVNSAVEAYAKTAAPGGKVTIKAEGFLAELSGVQLERRARELRIRPASDLKKVPPLKPPVFVRPDHSAAAGRSQMGGIRAWPRCCNAEDATPRRPTRLFQESFRRFLVSLS